MNIFASFSTSKASKLQLDQKSDKICEFWVNFDGSKVQNAKKFVKLKGNREFFVIKAFWRIYAKINVKFQFLLPYELIFDEFFSSFEHFHEFLRVFRLESFKIATWQKSVKIGPRSSQKANFCLFSFQFHDFFVKNVVKLFILYLSHFLNLKIQNQKSIKSLFCLRLLRNIEGALTRIRHRLIPRIFRAKTPILYPICFHDFSCPNWIFVEQLISRIFCAKMRFFVQHLSSRIFCAKIPILYPICFHKFSWKCPFSSSYPRKRKNRENWVSEI